MKVIILSPFCCHACADTPKDQKERANNNIHHCSHESYRFSSTGWDPPPPSPKSLHPFPESRADLPVNETALDLVPEGGAVFVTLFLTATLVPSLRIPLMAQKPPLKLLNKWSDRRVSGIEQQDLMGGDDDLDVLQVDHDSSLSTQHHRRVRKKRIQDPKVPNG
ncbi:hypothetical protein ACFX15_012633 [Malus domestica]